MRFYLIFMVLLLSITSCEDDADSIALQVVTEDLIFVSGERLIVSGRIIDNEGVTIEDHGFELSTDENFSNPIKISLGERTVPGRFVGKYNTLTVETNYWCRAYYISSGTTEVGNVISFSSQNVSILDYNPKVSNGGREMIIEGGNFPEDVQVFIGDISVPVNSIEFESILKVTIPERKDDFIESVSVVSGNNTLIFEEEFEYLTGEWQEEGFFVTPGEFTKALYMSDKSQIIFGMGSTQLLGSFEGMYNYSFENGEWDRIPAEIRSVIGAFNAYPYFGNGIVNVEGFTTVNTTNQFVKWDGESFELLPETEFALYNAVSFKLEGDLYVFGGENRQRENNREIYHYDTSSGEWNFESNGPADFNQIYPHFQIGDNAYFVTSERQIWKYNLRTLVWNRLKDFPFEVGKCGINIVNGTTVYVGLFTGSRLIWEYDSELDTWKERLSYQGRVDEDNNAAWFFDNKIYVMKDQTLTNDTKMKIWSFDPEYN